MGSVSLVDGHIDEIRDSGLLCPKCNKATTVYGTIQKENGTTKRYRKCLNCDYHFKTTECVREKDRSDTE